jgi:hypothetical protein
MLSAFFVIKGLMWEKPVFIDCASQSFFELIGTIWEANDEYSSDRVLHRLCSLMRKMGAQTIVGESLRQDDDLEVEEERNALSRYYNTDVRFNTIRLTFLADKISTCRDLEKTDTKNFLANAIIINAKWTEKGISKSACYLLRSIVGIPDAKYEDCPERAPLLNYYFHLYRDFECSVGLGDGTVRKYTKRGTFFCQQNSRTSVCAHSALKMLINNTPSDVSVSSELLTSEKINAILGIDHQNRTVGAGLRNQDVKAIFDHNNLTIIQQDFFNDPNLDYARFLHHFVESRCPSLLIFTTDTPQITHVVPILGHTLNSDMWRPEAEIAYSQNVPSNYAPYPGYRAASEWVDNFIIHDDNFGMYLCLPVDSLRRVTLPRYDPTFRACLGIGVVPCQISTTSREAEMASEFLIRVFLNRLKGVSHLQFWLRALIQEKRAPLVIRTALFARERYKAHLREYKDFEGNYYRKKEVERICQPLPDKFWLCELTLPDLYTTNKSKLVDILYPIDQPPARNDKAILEKCLLARFPGFTAQFEKGRVKENIPSHVNSHYPLFRVEQNLNLFEW